MMMRILIPTTPCTYKIRKTFCVFALDSCPIIPQLVLRQGWLSSNSSESHRETPLLLNSSDKSLGASLTARLGRTPQKQAHRDVNAGISNPPDAPPPETRSASALVRFVKLTPAGWLHEAPRFNQQPIHMTTIARIKSVHAAAVVHEQAAFAFRQQAFAAYEASLEASLDRVPDPVASALYDAGRNAHVAAYEALHALDKLIAVIA